VRRRPLDPKSRADLDRYVFFMHSGLATEVARAVARTSNILSHASAQVPPWAARGSSSWILRADEAAHYAREQFESLRRMDAQLLDPKLSTSELARRLIAGDWTEVRAEDGLLENCKWEWRQ
jgi:hypothetical protein